MPPGVTGQATDPGSAGVLGLPMNVDVPPGPFFIIDRMLQDRIT